MTYPKINLHKGKEISLLRRHPWVFSGAIAKKEGHLNDGDLVEIYSAKDEFLATGYYANGSIAVRIISFQKTTINEDFWIDKISKAVHFRKQMSILNGDTNLCRLFFGEGDGAPGLILDYFNGHVVLQAHSLGVYLQRDNIVGAIIKVLGGSLKSIYDKSAESMSKQLLEKTENAFIFGVVEEIIVKENNHSFKIDLVKGQKTGFFIDQRDNRNLLMKYARDKKVLNAFSYTGGFSVYAGAAGAAWVDSVDSSQPAIDLCIENMTLNNLKNHQGYTSDVFDFLKDKKGVYDVIVLDPPAFAKSRDSKHNAMKAYKRLNALAINQIREGGILFTFSCSGVVDKLLFYNTIASAAMEAQRDVKVLHYLTQPADHPVVPYFPEGEYLKGMALWIGE